MHMCTLSLARGGDHVIGQILVMFSPSAVEGKS